MQVNDEKSRQSHKAGHSLVHNLDLAIQFACSLFANSSLTQKHAWLVRLETLKLPLDENVSGWSVCFEIDWLPVQGVCPALILHTKHIMDKRNNTAHVLIDYRFLEQQFSLQYN